MLRSILYVSNSALGYSIDHQGRIGELVDKWRRWNQSVGITGAIVFTERHFVQLIEGPEAAIGELFAHIRADKRHTAVTVIQDTPTDERRFARWSLAYAGPDAFIDYDLAPLLQGHAGAAPDITAQLLVRLRAMAEV